MKIENGVLLITTEELSNAIGGDDSTLVIEDEEEWISSGKYDTRMVYLKHDETGLVFRFRESRSGSPFTDYTYWSELERGKTQKLFRYRQVEKTVLVWVKA